jgi:predicted transcriptional regulator
MSRPVSPILTDAELRIMRVLWARPDATNQDIVAALGDPPLARNTVMTTLGVLERKGYVSHRAQGRTFLYSATVSQDDVRSRALDSTIKRFFDGSARALVVKLLDGEHIDPADRARIARLIEELPE